jgi:hypothetical protein
MNHRGHGDPNVGLLEMIDSHQGFFEGSSPSQGFMALLHSIQTDLNLMGMESSGDLLGHQGAIGKENRPKRIVSQEIVDFPKMGMEQGLPSREEKSQPLDLFKFFEYLLNLVFREILMKTLPNVTVAALEIASICDLKFEITKRGDWGWIQGHLSLRRSFRENDQIFRKTKLDEFLVFLPERRMFASGNFKEKLIGICIQFIKFVVFDVKKIRFFKVF